MRDGAPTEASTFIGRRHELAEVRRLLAQGRLLTLTGAGGVGKSRLARRAAEILRPAYRDGVAVVDLAMLEDGDLLEPTIAGVLGIRETRRPTGSVLLRYLEDKRMLLVLDNCEHLPAACATLVDGLLRGAPRPRILATSRQTIGVYGERLLRVPPLAVPTCGEPPGKIVRREAVRLFADRAAVVRPGFTVDAANAPIVARIVQRLDGLPLAIELAAACLRAIPLDRLAHELDNGFAMLAGGSGTTSHRHQTLRATMDWSHGLCSPTEQRLWARLAIFPGGVDLDTAEEVCAGNDITSGEVLDLIAGLVDKSILNAEQYGSRTRYHMLESVRAYGHEHLTPSEYTALRRSYCARYRRLAAANRIDRIVPDQVCRFWTLQTELPNLRVALDSCFNRTCDTTAGLEIASSLWSYWLMSGTLTEGRRWLERGIGLTCGACPARLTALWACALLAIYQGVLGGARQRLDECRALAEAAGDESALAFALQTWGVAECSAGDPHRGHELMEQARECHGAIGDIHAVGLNLYLASLYCAPADPDQAAALGEELIALCDERNAPLFRAYAQFGLGIAAWIRGDWQRTETMMHQAAIPWIVTNDQWGLAQFLEVMAWTAGARGDHHRAARLLGAADAVWRDIHSSPVCLRYSEESHRRCAEHARRAVGDQAFGTAFRQGARLDLDQAIRLALVEARSSWPWPSGTL